MKKFFLISIVLAFAVWFGCSGDDNPTDSGNGGGGGGPQRIAANTTAGAPSMTNANDATWNAVAATAIDVSSSNSPKLTGNESQAAPDSIYFKAIVANDSLYLRIEYTDDSLNLLKDFLITLDSNANFAPQFYSQEDQVYVMFSGLPNGAWDVWSWRSLTTAPAGVAEGQVLDTSISGIPYNDNGNQVVALVNYNDSNFTRPNFVHNTGSSFTGQILFQREMEDFNLHTAEFYDSIGLVVPGWYVDDSVGIRVKLPAYKQSRWDIFAVHDYNATTNRLSVVLQCALDTGWPNDDLVLSDSVKVKIGIFDDQSSFRTQGSRRGFTQEFWLIL